MKNYYMYNKIDEFGRFCGIEYVPIKPLAPKSFPAETHVISYVGMRKQIEDLGYISGLDKKVRKWWK